MYAGDVSCKEVWESLKSETSALVDVRTTHEWQTIGVPDLSEAGKEPIFSQWQKSPDMSLNTDFAESVDRQLQSLGLSKDEPVYCLCRSGARSQAAASALTGLGYKRAYNIISGFEGDADGNGQRASLNGWQYDGLPWRRE